MWQCSRALTLSVFAVVTAGSAAAGDRWDYWDPRASIPARVIDTHLGVVALAAISPNGQFVFLREDVGSTSSLIEVEIESGLKRTLFQTENDRFNFSLDHDGQHVMIRYFQAISI